jgi:hypothetical protein
MADGDIVRLDASTFIVKLLDAHNAASAGPWTEVPGYFSVRSFHCDVAGTDTVNIEVSNAISTPSGTTSGAVARQLTGTNGATSSTLISAVTEAYRWVRAVKAGTANTSTVVLVAARND